MAIFGFIFCLVIFLLFLIGVLLCDEIDDADVGIGVFLTLLLVLTLALAANAFMKREVYYNKFNYNVEEIKEFKVDTTFTTLNGATDTTYTIYYNKESD